MISDPDPQVLIVGAGPTGLVLALWLTAQGVRVRIIDKTLGPGTTSRALDIQARTLELYRQLDLTDAVLARGHRNPAFNLWTRSRHAARVPFGKVGEALTPYAFLETFPQDEHERLLVDRLAETGVTVERQTELVSFEQEPDHIVASLRGPHGPEECRAIYLAGCDGARSLVRQAVGASFQGGTYRQLFYVADVEASGAAIDGELHVDLDEADFLGIFPLKGEGRARLIGTVRDERADRADSLRFSDVSQRAIDHLKIEVERVNWFSTYHVHHRVADRFRHGRVFLLGDAAHVHSPAGGQGMNTGIGDAINLAWKLAMVLAGNAPDALLDSYEAERIGFARSLVKTTDRVFSFATSSGAIARIVRTRIAPFLLPRLIAISPLRRFLFRTVSQTQISYRGSFVAQGSAGRLRGGDRLPWVRIDATDNFARLATIGWQVHCYGDPPRDLRSWCATRHIPLEVFAWQTAYRRAGIVRGTTVLLRPDTYIAVAAVRAPQLAFDRYEAATGLRLTRR